VLFRSQAERSSNPIPTSVLMGAMLGSLARSVYAVGLLGNMLWTTALMNIVHLAPMSKAWKEGVCLVLTQLAWRIALLFAPWMSIQGDDDYAEQWGLVLSLMDEYDSEDVREGKPRRPLFVLANHTSFFDTVLGVAKLPVQVLWRCRTYMAGHLFSFPILSTIGKSVGHFPVYFASDEDGVFKVDAKKMEPVEKRVDSYLQGGGWLSFFPEGQVNKNPEKIMPFRFGGMKKAIEYDARIVQMVFRGNEQVWPRKCQVGGFPGKVRYSMRPIAPDGARAFVQMARAEGAKEEVDIPDHAILAKRGQQLMQEQYEALAEDKQGALSKLHGKLQKDNKKD